MQFSSKYNTTLFSVKREIEEIKKQTSTQQPNNRQQNTQFPLFTDAQHATYFFHEWPLSR